MRLKNLLKSRIQSDWEQDSEFAESYLPEIKRILRENAMLFISVVKADEERDLEKATDLLVKVENGDVAVRVRRPTKKQKRDFTLRSWRKSGVKTELQKIREGFGRFYLYIWLDQELEVADWILVDLNALRASGCLKNSLEEILNKDGKTAFVILSLKKLKNSNCLLSWHGNLPQLLQPRLL